MGDIINIIILIFITASRIGLLVFKVVKKNNITGTAFLISFLIMTIRNLYCGYLRIYDYRIITALFLLFILLCLELANDPSVGNVLNLVNFIYIIFHEQIFTLIYHLL